MANKYYDNTRVSKSRECMRAYYFRHVRHWRREGLAPPLAFGLAWHDAMDVVWGMAATHNDNDLLFLAFSAWEKRWVAEGFPGSEQITPDDEVMLKMRTPGTALEMINEYIRERGKFIRENEVLACEHPFAVPLDPDDEERWYVGRLDKRMRLRQTGKIIVGEHKTTSLYARQGGIQTKQLLEYSPNSQVDGYLHANHMISGAEASSVWIDLALVHKTVHNVFKFVPVDREPTQLSAWLWETNQQINWIESNLNALSDKRDLTANNGAFLDVFPKNTNSCSGKYSRCGYSDLCMYVANPEAKWPEGSEPPDGYIEEKWEPFDVLELDKLGMEKGDG